MILAGTPEPKGKHWGLTDTEARKPGEQTGLDTPVVLALNDGYWVVDLHGFTAEAKVVSTPPGEYGRKAETQRN